MPPPPRKEPCRNFQRGSCQYGDRCKFLHVIPQQPKPNPFGFGSQNVSQSSRIVNSQQRNPNPFGFGVQTGSQATGFSDFTASKQNQFKPFENKWTRSSKSAGVASGERQPDNQSIAPNHKCTDPESCRRQIVEDFEHERPLWKLTCYGHVKNGPCDIVGDISYEELRALAYDDAKRGLNIQSIVERERSLLNSKLHDFETLLRNPIAVQSSTLATGGPFSGTSSNISLLSAQNSVPPSVSSFSQLGMSPVAPSNAPPQPNHFQAFGQTSSVYGTSTLSFQNKGVAEFLISRNYMHVFLSSKSGTAVSVGSQLTTQSFGRSLPSISEKISNNGITAEPNPFSTSGIMPPTSNLTNNQSTIFSNGLNSALAGSNANQNALGKTLRQNGAVDNSIWAKEEWRPGEIPEEAPPDEFLR